MISDFLWTETILEYICSVLLQNEEFGNSIPGLRDNPSTTVNLIFLHDTLFYFQFNSFRADVDFYRHLSHSNEIIPPQKGQANSI